MEITRAFDPQKKIEMHKKKMDKPNKKVMEESPRELRETAAIERSSHNKNHRLRVECHLRIVFNVSNFDQAPQASERESLIIAIRRPN